MKAITIWQPWAACISHGEKRVENRTWGPPEKLKGEFIAIHAGLTYDAEAEKTIRECPYLKLPDDHHRSVAGAIVAVAKIGALITESHDPWFSGPRGWELLDVCAMPTPIPARGLVGLWQVPEDVEQQILAQAGEWINTFGGNG